MDRIQKKSNLNIIKNHFGEITNKMILFNIRIRYGIYYLGVPAVSNHGLPSCGPRQKEKNTLKNEKKKIPEKSRTKRQEPENSEKNENKIML